MKIKLSVLVFGGLASSALIGAAGMTSALSYSLDRGFNSYLAARDEDQISAVVRNASLIGEEMGGIASYRRGEFTLTQLLDRAGFSMPPHPPAHRRSAGPQRPPEGLPGRSIVLSIDGSKVWGPPDPRNRKVAAATIQHAVVLSGNAIGSIAVLPRGPTPDGMDRLFLTSQYRAATFLFLILLCLSLIPAWLIARKGGGMAHAMKLATREISLGSYEHRAPDSVISEVQEVSADINAMSDHLSQLQGARQRWLAELSHELRTPLSAMRCELDALADGIRPTSFEAIVSLREEVERLGSLIDDLHFLAVSDLAGPRLTLANCDALSLCRDIVTKQTQFARDGGVALDFEGPDRGAIAVRWDQRRIEQVLINLVINGVTHTDTPGKVILKIEASQHDVCLTIDDTSPGVSDEDLELLIEPLFRANTGLSRSTGGSGLGLSVSAAIIAAHGGTIATSHSALGGLRHQIQLPRLAGE